MPASNNGLGFNDQSFQGLSNIKTVECYEFLQVNTTSSTAITSTGSNAFTVASATNIAVDQQLSYDTGSSQEYVVVTAVSGTSITATFSLTHASGAVVTVKVQRQAVVIGDPTTIGALAGVTTKGVQTPYALQVTDLTNCGRALLTFVSDPATVASTAETAITCVQNLNFVQLTGETYYTVSSGKIARIQQLVVSGSSAMTAATVQFRVRGVASGTPTTSSPIFLTQSFYCAGGGGFEIPLLNGELELPSGASIMLTRQDSLASVVSLSVTLYGYEY